MLGIRSLRFGLSVCVVGLGTMNACGGAPPPPAKAKPPAELAGLREANSSMKEKWSSTDDEIKNRCELSDGDCMMQVRDQRFELLGTRAFPECDAESGNEREACEEQSAVDAGKGKQIAGLYEFHNRCLTQMLQCTAKLEAEALEKMKVARAETRMAQLLANGKNESAHVEALAAKEGVAYLRSTLPPKEEGACTDMDEVKSCVTSAEAQAKDLTEELRKDDGDYNEDYAATIYQDAQLAEAKCYEPEFACLQERARRWGATPDTAVPLKKNLELIKQRERLGLRVAPETAAKCKAEGIAKNQQSIISAYTTYARQPVLFFRKKLHQAFYKLHEDQLACLRGQPMVAPAKPTPAPKQEPPKAPAKTPQPEPESHDSMLQAQR